MRRIAGPLAVAIGLLLTSSQKHPLLSHSAAPQGAWQALFNGRDLEGWVPKFAGHPLGKDVNDTFRVEKGRLIVSMTITGSWTISTAICSTTGVNSRTIGYAWSIARWADRSQARPTGHGATTA